MSKRYRIWFNAGPRWWCVSPEGKKLSYFIAAHTLDRAMDKLRDHCHRRQTLQSLAVGRHMDRLRRAGQ